MELKRLDRTAFNYQTKTEAAHNLKLWKSQTYKKRLQTANYLNSVAYNFDFNNSPKMDKTYFNIRKRENG